VAFTDHPINLPPVLRLQQSRRRWLAGAAPLLTWLTTVPKVLAAESGAISYGGRIYMDALAWGKKLGFTVQWTAKTGDLRFSSRWSRLAFKVDTARVDFNGVMIWLSDPVLRSGSKPYLGRTDVVQVLDPLLNPPRAAAGGVQVVALSAGHGGRDPGNLEGKRLEKDYTLKLAKELERLLVKSGLKVVQIRERDSYIEHEERNRIANRRQADVYLSLHYNANPSARGSASGFETYTLTLPYGRSTNGGRSPGPLPGNKHDRFNLTLAYQIHKAVLGGFDFSDRGIRRANFAELRLAEMPAVLIEGGFMDSRQDALKIFSDSQRTKFAQAITDGVLAYKRLIERGQPE